MGFGALCWTCRMARIVLGLHYPSDVLVGLLLGTVLGVIWVTA